MIQWRNWQTRKIQDLVSYDVGLRAPSGSPSLPVMELVDIRHLKCRASNGVPDRGRSGRPHAAVTELVYVLVPKTSAREGLGDRGPSAAPQGRFDSCSVSRGQERRESPFDSAMIVL